jgi:molybdate transport system regulatory protein
MTEIVPGAGRPRAGLAGIRPAHRIWLEDEGLPVFGVGISELLKRVEATGSLRCAATDMGMAYSKAWQIVRRAEDHLGFKLMTRRTGGRGGGCSIVSEDGIRLSDAFDAYARDAEVLLAELFARRFSEWSDALGDMSSDCAAASQGRGE